MTSDTEKRVVIEAVSPEVDGGRFAAKRCLGDQVVIGACIHADGTAVLAARLLYRLSVPSDAVQWQAASLALVNAGLDLWEGRFRVDHLGRYEFTIEAWPDRFATWLRDLRKKNDAGLDVSSELLEGAALLRRRRPDAALSPSDAAWLDERARFLEDTSRPRDERLRSVLEARVHELMAQAGDRGAVSVYKTLPVRVERERARVGAWYEFFPRSASKTPGRSATLRDAEARLTDIARMGFDVVYLPPIHPIGHTHRKGPNNTPAAGPQDPGSPWAIGSEAGGHKAVDPALGGLEAFDQFRKHAESLGMEVALDIAFQCSPDHPYVREHPEWFRKRPDGTIKYAENPPKKYEDIFPFDFESPAWRSLWNELRDVTLFWAERGVRCFRVDNPHTKPYAFWEWLIEEVQARFPDAVFLAEAFTRPPVMQHLAKLGFSQSYTYFTWRNSKAELTDYLTELTQPQVKQFMRPNFFANTPDILTEYLQRGGRPAFIIRLILAATLSESYGLYGPPFELCEAKAFPGTEDYVDSEKYQLRHWDETAPGNIRELIATVNRIRKEQRALRHALSFEFHPVSNDELLFYSKKNGSNVILVVVNLDPRRAQEGWLQAPLKALELPETYQVEDLLTGARYTWHGERNYVRLDPSILPAHILKATHG